MSLEPSPRERALARIASRVVRASTLVREAGVATGLPEVDRALGPAGIARGSLVDLHAPEGARALELALALAARLEPARGRAIVLVDPAGDFYPPAAAQAGVDLERLIVVRPGRAETLPALDEALRSSAVAAVVARVSGLDPRTSHRLRVAAEASGAVGVLVRPLEERTAISAAAVRLLVEPCPDPRALEPPGALEGALRVVPLRVRGEALAPALETRPLPAAPDEAAS